MNEESDDTATVEHEVERTQDAIGETIGKLEEKLSPRRIARSLMSDENSDNARELWEVVRQSPVPVALIVGGAAWLVASSQAPLIRRLRSELKERFRSASGSHGSNSQRRTSTDAAPIGPPPSAGEVYDRRSPALDSSG